MSGYIMNNDRENRNIGYEVQIEVSHLGKKIQRARGPAQRSDQNFSQVGVTESP